MRTFFRILILLRCFYGAYTCARAAFKALIGVDNVFAVFFGNSAYRALVCAAAASEALFGIDNIRHNSNPLKIIRNIKFERSRSPDYYNMDF